MSGSIACTMPSGAGICAGIVGPWQTGQSGKADSLFSENSRSANAPLSRNRVLRAKKGGKRART
jgi:hypothetical protein